MTPLLLKFGINLENSDRPITDQHFGPLFHRWLPDGEKHAVVLDTGDSNARLRVWFVRFGFVGTSYIQFDYDRREVDSNIIPKQAVLEAGPLIGLLEIQGLSEEELTAIREDQVGNELYLSLGKKVVEKMIHPPVSRFLDILRTNYGQYWIPRLEKWDSRKESLGSYCSSFQLKWSLDDRRTWKDFVPDQRVVRITATISSFRGYLTEKDWNELEKTVHEGYEPTLAAIILSRTHQFLDQGNLKHALIEGVTALELVINEFISLRLHGADTLSGSMKAFWEMPLRAQAVSVATILGNIPAQDIEYVIKAIDMRNKVVHEGWDPPEDAKVQLRGLLNTVAAMLSGPRFRFLTANPGNAIMSPEDWEKRETNS